jgi:iron-sulfur cluster assembly accessory protein
MIEVTDSAVRQLRSLLEEKGETGGKGLRVQVAKGGCSGMQYEMLLDARKDGDAIVEQHLVLHTRSSLMTRVRGCCAARRSITTTG